MLLRTDSDIGSPPLDASARALAKTVARARARASSKAGAERSALPDRRAGQPWEAGTAGGPDQCWWAGSRAAVAAAMASKGRLCVDREAGVAALGHQRRELGRRPRPNVSSRECRSWCRVQSPSPPPVVVPLSPGPPHRSRQSAQRVRRETAPKLGCGISRGFRLVSISRSHRIAPDHRSKIDRHVSSDGEEISVFPRHSHDLIARGEAPGTRRHLLRTVPDQLETPQEPTGFHSPSMTAFSSALICFRCPVPDAP
jgi:hypothetical protein